MAALLAQERTDLGPVGLLSAASGHPIPLVTFRVTLLSNRLEQQVALPETEGEGDAEGGEGDDQALPQLAEVVDQADLVTV